MMVTGFPAAAAMPRKFFHEHADATQHALTTCRQMTAWKGARNVPGGRT